MKKILSILLIMLLLTACGTKDDVLPSQPDSDPAPQASKALPELEETDWEALSTDAAAFGLSGGPDDPNFEYIFNHTGTVPLDQLVAFTLTADGLSEGATDELYHRFLEAPHKVLAYLVLLDGQITELPGWEPMPAAEIVCQFIATTAARKNLPRRCRPAASRIPRVRRRSFWIFWSGNTLMLWRDPSQNHKEYPPAVTQNAQHGGYFVLYYPTSSPMASSRSSRSSPSSVCSMLAAWSGMLSFAETIPGFSVRDCSSSEPQAAQ